MAGCGAYFSIVQVRSSDCNMASYLALYEHAQKSNGSNEHFRSSFPVGNVGIKSNPAKEQNEVLNKRIRHERCTHFNGLIPELICRTMLPWTMEHRFTWTFPAQRTIYMVKEGCRRARSVPCAAAVPNVPTASWRKCFHVQYDADDVRSMWEREAIITRC